MVVMQVFMHLSKLIKKNIGDKHVLNRPDPRPRLPEAVTLIVLGLLNCPVPRPRLHEGTVHSVIVLTLTLALALALALALTLTLPNPRRAKAQPAASHKAAFC